jgi:hypothetical protein
MVLRAKGAKTAPKYDTEFEVTSRKNGELVLRAITHDGKKFNLATITEAGLKLRPGNNHPHLNLPVDGAGCVKIAA